MLIFSLIALLWLGAILVLLVKTELSKHRFAFGVTILATILTAFLAFNPSPLEIWQDWGGTIGALSFRADALGISLTFLALVLSSLCILFSWDYMAGHPQLGRYYALILFFVGAMIGLVLSNSFLLLFFFWELTALCSYALIAFESDSPQAAIGGSRALIITQIGGLGLLLTALLVFQVSGNYEIDQFLNDFSVYPDNLKLILAFGILAASAAKSAQVPFHTWLAGAMEAPTPVSALIHAATMVNAGVYLLIRLYPAFESIPYWKESLIAIGMISALLAALLALTSHDLKALLAYSTISQLGYMIYAIGLGALFAAQLQLISHAIFKALLFLSSGAIIHNLSTRDMHLMGGLWQKMPFVRTVLLIGTAALVGIPFANGFWSKELILEAGLEHGAWTYYLMLLGVGLTAAYSLRMLLLVLAGDNKTLPQHETGQAMKLSLGILAFAVLSSWLPFSSFIKIDAYPLMSNEVLLDIVLAPSTYLALALISMALFFTYLWHRKKLKFDTFKVLFESQLGFTSLNIAVINFTQALAGLLSGSQTGILNWNLFGILLALAILLLLKGGSL